MPRVLRNFVFPAVFPGVQLAELLHVFVTEKPESYQKMSRTLALSRQAEGVQQSQESRLLHNQIGSPPRVSPESWAAEPAVAVVSGVPGIWGQVL